MFKRDALPFAAQLRQGSYEIAFADPPYESRMLDWPIESWQRTPFAAMLAAEHARGHDLPCADQRRTMRTRRSRSTERRRQPNRRRHGVARAP